MKRRTDGSFLPENVDGTSLRDVGLPVSNAHRLYEEKIDFACLGGRKNKSLNHPYLVTTVTDSNNSGLVMFRYSANSVCEFAAGSSSGEIQVDFRPSLNRAHFPGRSQFQNSVSARRRQPNTGSHREQVFSNSISKNHVLIHSQLSENGNQRASGLPASGSKRV